MTTVGASLLSLSLATTAQAEIDTSFSVGYNTDYVFRGYDLGDNAFEYGFSVSGDSDLGFNWNAGIWNIDSDLSGGVSNNELDYYASVSKDLGQGTVTFGFTHYEFEVGGSDAGSDTEIYLGYGTSYQGVSANLNLYYGVDGFIDEQILLEGSLGYSYELSSTMSLSLSGTVAYIFDDANDNDGYAYSSISASLNIALSDEISLTPYLTYANGDSDIIGDAGGTRFNGFLYGAKLSYTF